MGIKARVWVKVLVVQSMIMLLLALGLTSLEVKKLLEHSIVLLQLQLEHFSHSAHSFSLPQSLTNLGYRGYHFLLSRLSAWGSALHHWFSDVLEQKLLARWADLQYYFSEFAGKLRA